MLEKFVSGILIIVGIVNLLPLAVFFDFTKTVKLYAVPIEGENLIILMRHRAILLSLVGIALIVAAFKPEHLYLALTLALTSKIAFIFLIFTATNPTSEIKKVALIDVAAILLLFIALGVDFYNK